MPLSKEAIAQHITRLNSTIEQPRWKVIEYNGTKDTATSSTDNNGEPVQQESELTVLEANYKLKDFRTTWNFLNSIAKLSHENKHHPTISTTYNKVKVNLTTHDIGNRVSFLDTKMAELFEIEYFKCNTTKPKSSSPISLTSASKIINELVNLEKKDSKSHEQ